MKNKVQLMIWLFFGFSFLVYVFPFYAVHAEKFQSGVTIAPSTAETETICDDAVDNDNDGKIDAADEDCAAPPPICGDDTILENGMCVPCVTGMYVENGMCVPLTSIPGGEEICDDTIDNDNDGKVDATDEDCAATSSQPGVEICANGQDDNGDGTVDEAGCTQQADATAGTCGLQIVSGVPINYGQLTIGQESSEQMVEIKNEGTSPIPARIMMKGEEWISDIEPDPALGTISGAEATRVSEGPAPYDQKTPLSSGAQELGQLPGGQSTTINFQLKLDNAPSEVGAFHQDVTIDLLC